jgi:hypothetical protein
LKKCPGDRAFFCLAFVDSVFVNAFAHSRWGFSGSLQAAAGLL